MRRPYTIDVREEAARLRREGLSYRAIAEQVGVSVKTAQRWLNPVVAERERDSSLAWKRRQRGICEECGGETRYGGHREGRMTVGRWCVPCYNKRREAQHGTRSKYEAGCSCDACRRANREYMRGLKGQEPPTHSNSGYQNYGCRCQVCREAHLVYNRAKGYEYQKAYYRRQREKAASA